MSSSVVSVSVVIITYCRPEYVQRCLEHLRDQVEPAEQIIVVDSSPDALTAQVVAGVGEVRYLSAAAWAGDMTRARNAALAAVSGDVIAFLDDDAFVTPSYLAELRRAYQDPDVGLGCSRTLNGVEGESNELGAGIGRLLPNGELTGQFAYASPRLVPIDHGIGATMSFRRETLHALGGFRPGYRGTCVREETDAFLRARALGFRAVFIPRAVAEHVAAPHARGRRFDLRYEYWLYRNHALLLIRNFGIRTPLLRRWIKRSYGVVFGPAPGRSISRRAARISLMTLGLTHGIALSMIRGRGRALPPARRSEAARRLRDDLARYSKRSVASSTGQT